ncbi:alpha/beta fold hydrolase [Hymenobacter ginsengisoli]|uniref:Alpha/beta fold hydrolase n=1 Tax=Hymenobacter ginsengisoli TaxID=1051626 RepID=A0ABP8QCC0_9BACT|nr:MULTISPECIES: alpha/beta fold hydrolase [unclassified Hymenobacter]MBO2032005.1 alpha/beta hydrolase [Hymenobacter sp. BT559]
MAARSRPATGEPPRLNGQWQGPLKVPGGTLTLIITIVPLSNGTYYAALDVPQQRISRMPVEVELKDDNIKLSIEQAGSRFEGNVQAGGDRLVGSWQQPGLKTELVLARGTAPAAAQAAKKLRLTPPYRESEVTVYNPVAKIKLSGTLTIPSGEGPFAAVALVSDSGPQERDADVPGYRPFGMLADYLTRHGVAVLRYDDRGVGKSGGDFSRATTADFVTDARAALAFLRDRPLIAPQQVGLLGLGEGGNVALLAAAEPLEAPNFVASLAAYGQPGRDVLRRQQGEIMRLIGADGAQVKAAQGLFDRLVETVRQTPNTTVARAKIITLLRSSNSALDEPMARARAVQLTSPWSRYFFDFDPANRLALVRCPVLLLNGTADLQVAAGRNMSLLQKGLRQSDQPVQAHRLGGVNHLFQDDPAKWPIVAGERQAAFSTEGLTYLQAWLLERARLAKTPVPVTVRRPAPRPRAITPMRPRVRRATAAR